MGSISYAGNETKKFACVASVSTRENWDESKKKGMMGEGEGREEIVAVKNI